MAFPYNGVSTGSTQASPEQSLYNSYLLTEPFGRSPLSGSSGLVNVDRWQEILRKSADYFARQNQPRTVERLRLELALSNMRNNRWSAALETLLSIWPQLSWRQEGWWDLLADIDWTLKDCARKVRDQRTLVAVEWELLCNSKRLSLRSVCLL